MDNAETIRELCAIVTEVGAHFEHEFSHDCFCENRYTHTVVDKAILDFIRDAVREKIERQGKQ
jgi:hypothetical protein